MTLLLHILQDSEIKQVLLFSRTKHGADRITKNLKRKHVKAAAIHGDKGQNQRQKVLAQFKNGNIRVLVATDIAARGIDIDKLKYVINYSFAFSSIWFCYVVEVAPISKLDLSSVVFCCGLDGFPTLFKNFFCRWVN